MPQTYSLNDIHDQNFELEVDRLTEKDVEQLLTHKQEFIEFPCPACGSEELIFDFEGKGFSYKRCLHCELLLLSPAPDENRQNWYIANSEALKFWREKMPPEVRESRKIMYQERVDYVLSKFKKYGMPRKVFEIGAGNGEFAEALVTQDPSSVSRLVLVEPQPLNISLPNVEVIPTILQDWNSDETFDAAIAFEVIEHILDPSKLLATIHNHLAPGGIFIFSTPNAKSFETQLLKGLSSNILYDHVRLYNPTSLQLLFNRHGFEIVEIETPGQLDVEMVRRQYAAGRIDLSEHPALKFLMEDGYVHRNEFQQFLRVNKLSSHMRCVARRRE